MSDLSASEASHADIIHYVIVYLTFFFFDKSFQQFIIHPCLIDYYIMSIIISSTEK
jgi:hypothetical protein